MITAVAARWLLTVVFAAAGLGAALMGLILLPVAFVNWRAEPTIGTGYSCPGPGQVVGAQQSYVTPHNGRLFVAGEHTSPAWFGFMEGALESGIAAVARIARLAGVELRDEWGGTSAL